MLHDRLQWYINQELPDVQAGFRKDSGIRDQTANIHPSVKKIQFLELLEVRRHQAKKNIFQVIE